MKLQKLTDGHSNYVNSFSLYENLIILRNHFYN